VIKISRRGQGANTLRLIILIMIITVVLVTFTYKMISTLSGGLPREICRTSVLARYSSKLPGLEQEPKFDVECYTQVLNIDKKGIEKIAYNGVSRKKFRLVSFKNMDVEEKEEAIRRNLANEMFDCWYQFHRGKLDFYGDWGGEFSTERTRCIVCTEVNFDSSVKEELSSSKLTGLQKFLFTKLITQKDFTYMEYFFNIEDKNELTADMQNVDKDFGDEIFIDKQYSIVYSVTKEKAWGKALAFSGAWTLTGAAAGAKVGLVLAPWTAGVSVVAMGVGGAIVGGGLAFATLGYDLLTEPEKEGIPGMIFQESSELPNICSTLY